MYRIIRVDYIFKYLKTKKSIFMIAFRYAGVNGVCF